jgi:hypothetical protein
VPALLEEPAPATTAQVDRTKSGQSGGKRTFTRPATPKPLPRICPTDVPGQLRARRAASQRMVPLDCDCRDPLACRCGEDDITPVVTNAYKDAVQHLLAHGLTPAAFRAEARVLWRRGGEDRRLAVEITEAWGLAG